MKTRLLLLLVAAATLCGCDHSYYKYAYYTFINGTDKTIIVTLYDQTYYSDEWGPGKNPNAKPVYNFTITPGGEFTKILTPPPTGGFGTNIADPFDDLKFEGLSISNGEWEVGDMVGAYLYHAENYDITKETKDVVYLQYIFTEEFFKRGYLILTE